MMKDLYKSEKYKRLKDVVRDKLDRKETDLFFDVVLEAVLYGMERAWRTENERV